MDANTQSKNFQELKRRKVHEIISGELKFTNRFDMTARPGSDETVEKTTSQLEVQERIRLKTLRDQQHQLGIANIKAKHITEFANEQLTDFAAVLGLPEISLEDLAKKKDQPDLVVTDAVRERAYFARQLEGYPSYFSDVKEPGTKLGLHTESVGLFDFYDSLSIVPKINAALFQTFAELVNVNKPENGLAVSALESELYKEARVVVKRMRMAYEAGSSEEDFKS